MTKRFIAAALAVLLAASCSGSTPEEAPPTLTVGDNKIMWEIVSSLGTLAQARECIIGEPERRVCIGCKQFTLINSAPSSYRCTNCNFTSVSVVGQHSGERVLRDYLQAEATATSVA